MDIQSVYTLGDIARSNGCQTWQVRRLFERGLLDEPQRVGTYRVVRAEQLLAVTAALRDAGYLPTESREVAAEAQSGNTLSQAVTPGSCKNHT